MKFTAFSLLAAMVFSTVNAVTVPGADTPSFYLVASSTDPAANLLPLRVTGGTDFYSTLTGDGPIGQFYFYQGKLTSASPWITPYIGSSLGPIQCTTYGYLGFAQGGSTDKCARYDTFQIQSNSQNAQLGAKLTFNFVGDFYACGSGLDVWYMVSPDDGPADLQCNRLDLYTVPVN